MKEKKIFFYFLIFFILQSCASSVPTAEKRNIFEESRENYFKGLKALQKGSYEEAISLFQKVSRGQRYIKYTPLAKIRIGDCFYLQEKFEEAIAAYKDYIETSSGDANLHYGYFRIAECLYRAIPASFFLLPPIEEKDMSQVFRAYNALKEFLKKFPNSPYVGIASEFYNKCLQHILKYELGVIDFYWSRKKYNAVISRIENIFENYSASKNIEDLYPLIIESYVKINEKEKAKKIVELYFEKFPYGKYATKMKNIE